MDNNFEETELLLRAVRPGDMYWKDGHLSSAAFKDKYGLSVNRVYDQKIEEALSVMIKKFSGSIVSVSVSDCNTVFACVKYLPSKDNLYHCEIHQSETIKILNEYQAKHLANVAQILYFHSITSETT